MILRPDSDIEPQNTGYVPAWEAVERAERTRARSYALVRQSDHAVLSAVLAQRFAIPDMPPLTDEIVRGISLHDDGWSAFDSGGRTLRATPAHYSPEGIPCDEQGTPLTFVDIMPGDFLAAWRDSIVAAQEAAPIAGLIVSGHFYRLGRFGLNAARYTGGDAEMVRRFLDEEEQHQAQLLRRERRTAAEIEYWTDMLQFCDLLSLYLCCGSQEWVDFPQRITRSGEAIRLRVEDGVYVLLPTLFAAPVRLSLNAYSLSRRAPALLERSLR